MSKIVKRLLTFFVAIPLFIYLTWFCTFKNHFVLNCIVVAAVAVAAIEMHALLSHKLAVQPRSLVVVLSALVAAAGFICVLFGLPMEYSSFVFILSLFILLIFEIFRKSSEENQFEQSIQRMTSSVFTILYSAFLLTFVQRIMCWQYAKENLIVFLLMVFICDSLAWLLGITMGKNNRGFIKASPNKSLMGFIGGFIGSIAIGILAHMLLPEVFFGSYAKAVLLGFATAFASILGDLTESVIKRSAGVKDSGNIIPGRGGLLDSIDSIVMAAPIYVILAHFLYNFS